MSEHPRRARPGFTLIELVVVILVITILASIAAVSTFGVRDQAYVSTLRADLRSLALKQELYYQIHDQYAPTLDDLEEQIESAGVTLQVTHAAADAFAATGSHSGLDDVVCGYYVGDVPEGVAGPADQPETIMCDE